MKSKPHTPEQVIASLADGDKMLSEGKTVAEVARSFGITETTWYRWKHTYGGMKGPHMKRLQELEVENRRLKIMVADLTLDKAMLTELAEGNFSPRTVGAAREAVAPAASGSLSGEPVRSLVNHDPPSERSPGSERTPPTPRSPSYYGRSRSPVLARETARPPGRSSRLATT